MYTESTLARRVYIRDYRVLFDIHDIVTVAIIQRERANAMC